MKRGNGRHRTRRRVGGRIARILLGILVFLTLLSSGTAFAAYRYDQAAAARILPGVRVAGVDVGGLTHDQAVAAVQLRMDAELSKELRAGSGSESAKFTPEGVGTRARVIRAVDAALAVSARYTWAQRVYHRVWQKPVGQDIPVELVANRQRIAAFVAELASRMNVSPSDAAVDWADGQLVLQRAQVGRALKLEAAKRSIEAVAEGRADAVELEFRRIAPTVTAENLGKTIVVRTGSNRLYLYDGLDVVREYGVATGTSEYPTPLGHFSIINKRLNPTWVNGAQDTWGADLPDTIGPGPGNPLGTRALDLSAPGIRIHGTYADYSIGTHASHGCIRMHIAESEELFDLVDVGTPVIIVY